jgi:hypothetical protein
MKPWFLRMLSVFGARRSRGRPFRPAVESLDGRCLPAGLTPGMAWAASSPGGDLVSPHALKRSEQVLPPIHHTKSGFHSNLVRGIHQIHKKGLLHAPHGKAPGHHRTPVPSPTPTPGVLPYNLPPEYFPTPTPIPSGGGGSATIGYLD